jgi:hypothetical protein
MELAPASAKKKNTFIMLSATMDLNIFFMLIATMVSPEPHACAVLLDKLHIFTDLWTNHIFEYIHLHKATLVLRRIWD